MIIELRSPVLCWALMIATTFPVMAVLLRLLTGMTGAEFSGFLWFTGLMVAVLAIFSVKIERVR
jgi:hypothetical protein